jgi:hypothetical protein
MGSVGIKDNFFEKDLINFLNDYFLNLPHYYGHSSTGNSEKFYTHHFNVDNPLINFLCTKINKNIKILRVYINIQYNNMNGEFHTDDADTTYLVMVSNTLEKGSGQFQLINKNNEIQSIDFIQNRMIFFTSNLKHRGLAPLEKNTPRITLAFKTIKI